MPDVYTEIFIFLGANAILFCTAYFTAAKALRDLIDAAGELAGVRHDIARVEKRRKELNDRLSLDFGEATGRSFSWLIEATHEHDKDGVSFTTLHDCGAIGGDNAFVLVAVGEQANLWDNAVRDISPGPGVQIVCEHPDYSST